uniref:F-box domain-containing protein n=1 Tax=Strongyloides papillosus TaxID=174720 RepID=A0A0N5BBI0_STREA
METNTESYYLKFSLTSLPDEIVKFVLEKLDWKTIYNLRLASKYLNAIILKDFYRFAKSEMRHLYIKSTN